MIAGEIASIARAMYDIGKADPIFETSEEGFPSPSIYFPPVEQTPIRDTLSSFKYDNAMYVKVFADTTKKASEIAQKIVHTISEAKNMIKEVSESGEKTGREFRIKIMSCKQADLGAYQIYLRWDSVFLYDRAAQKVANFIFTNSIKEV